VDYALFVILNFILFVRPSEIVPALAEIPIYEITILCCLAAALPKIVGQLSLKSLKNRPVSLFVIGVWFAVVFSILFGMYYWSGAKDVGLDFGKVILYYLLMVAVIDRVSRLERFLGALCVLTAIVAGIAVMQYQELIEIPELTVLKELALDPATGEVIVIPRIRATGIFHDPNDLSMLAILGITCASYGLSVPRWRHFRPLFLLGIAFFLYTLMLTHSRGGLLALLIAGTVLFQSRFGWKRAIPLIAIAIPLALVLFGGRQTGFGDAVSEGTGQNRIQLWSTGLVAFRQSPLFGIGYGQYVEEAGQVAHNSFVHAFTELGFFGGSLFLAAFLYPLWAIYRIGDPKCRDLLPPELARMRPYLLAAIAGYAGAMLTLSRNYIVPTYLILGLAAAYLRFVQASVPLPELKLNQRMVGRLAVASVAFLACTYVFVRVFARWSA
jgi:O-antigen ligase